MEIYCGDENCMNTRNYTQTPMTVHIRELIFKSLALSPIVLFTPSLSLSLLCVFQL